MLTAVTLCSKGCGRRAQRRGWCASHYNQQRDRLIAYGRWESVYTDAAPARAHVLQLRAAGMGSRRISELSSVNRSQIETLLNGRPERGTGPSRKVHRDLAAKLLAVPVPEAPHRGVAARARIPAVGTTRRLQALVAFGWSQSYLCARLGITDSNGTCLFTGKRTSVTAATARKVEALFAELQLTPGTNQRARTRGLRRGWAPPLAWDDDTIDDPAAVPDSGEHQSVSWADRYHELRDLGFSDVDIMRKWNAKPQSFITQLRRYGIPQSLELKAFMRDRMHGIVS